MDALGLAPPSQLSFDGNQAENWRKWKRSFENFLLAINSVTQPADEHGVYPAANGPIWRRQIAILRHCIGEDAVEVLDQFEFDDEEDQDRLPDVLQKFDEYFNPRRNALFEWFVFWSLTQAEGEPIDMFVKRLKTQAAMCEFGDLRDMMILCRCVFGISNLKLKEKLLQDPGVTLNGAIGLIRASEITKSQIESMSASKSIAAIEKSAPPAPAPRKITNCKYCGYDHIKGKCPAYGQACRKCGQKNHFMKVCTSTRKEVSTVDVEEGEPSMNQLFIALVSDDNNQDSWTKEYDIVNNGRRRNVKFKLDTGAQANILPMSVAKDLGAEIKPSQARLVSYGGDPIRNYGRVILSINSQGDLQPVAFELVDEGRCPVLGLTTCVKLCIVRRVDGVTTEDIISEYDVCFKGIGRLDREHEIKIDPSVKPVVNRARRIPLSMTEKVKAELQKMEDWGIIAKVDEPTEWVSSMVVAEKKDGSVRICLDPRELNKAIQREHHHIPTLDDIAHKFSGMKLFTILDMKHAYWHIPLDRKSQLLTTFNTPFGRKCFLRLPFGINSAAEVFEKRVEEMFGDLQVAIYFDDLIVFGQNQEEHDANLKKLLERAKKYNVKFNKDKLQLNQHEVKYLGHIVSAEGLRPDPEKVLAINDMPNPTDSKGIQRLMGSLNFLRGFIPNISEITEPLRALLNVEESDWVWGPEQNNAMKKIKDVLTSQPLLQYFDPLQETTVQVDSSKSGLGAVLMQNNHPIAYASRALTSAEQNWPQIDKELLAIVYGFEKFHSYVYGRPVDVQTDHNPLVSIVRKELHKASPRLQKLLLRLMKYHVNRISYVPGKYLYLADTLSRAYIGNSDGELEEDIVMVHTVQICEEKEAALREAYDDDNILRLLKDTILEGWNWPTKARAPIELHPYWNIRDELYIQSNLIYKGEQLLIPRSLRAEYLRILHRGHLGTTKCSERARQYMFWPGMATDIREMVSSCTSCQKYSNQQQREPLEPHEIPQLPWNKVGMDLMDFQDKAYLIVVDFHSHYPEIRLVKHKRAEDVIIALKSIFAVHGVPREIIADNMPFNSFTMTKFAADWGFKITTSSPNYPKSNGLAERYVQTIKQFLRKTADTGDDLYESLLAYRQTPLTGMPFSPAEMLFSRNIRGPLPCTVNHLKPGAVDSYDSLAFRQLEQKARHDRSARSLTPLQGGEEIVVRTNKDDRWMPASIVEAHSTPRSYIVDNGRNLVRRNRVHIKPAANGNSNQQPTDHGAIPATPRPANTEDRSAPTTTISPGPVDHTTPKPSPRHSIRANRGTLPARFDGFHMG